MIGQFEESVLLKNASQVVKPDVSGVIVTSPDTEEYGLVTAVAVPADRVLTHLDVWITLQLSRS